MASFSQVWKGLESAGAAAPYVLVDCAGLEQGAAGLPTDAFSEVACLFTGDMATELADVAPYLARIKEYGEAAESAAEHLLRQEVGMLVVPGTNGSGQEISFSELHRHLRKFNVVYDPDGNPLMFRYYDSRVILEVLSVLEPDQLEGFFGPIDSLVVMEGGSKALRCYRQDGKLVVLE